MSNAGGWPEASDEQTASAMDGAALQVGSAPWAGATMAIASRTQAARIRAGKGSAPVGFTPDGRVPPAVQPSNGKAPVTTFQTMRTT